MTDNIVTFRTSREFEPRRIEGSVYMGGSGGDGGMETRIGRLEVIAARTETRLDNVDQRLEGIDKRLGKVDDRLGSIDIGIATLNERVSHLPGKGYTVTVTILALAFFSSLMLFGERILALVN